MGKETEVDRVEVIWPNGNVNVFENVGANKTITAKFSDAKATSIVNTENPKLLASVDAGDLGVNFTHKENEFDEYVDEILLPHNVSQNGPFIASEDVNGDGLEDMFVGGAFGQSGMLYIQTSNGSFTESASQPWEQDKGSEDLGCVFIDVDNDNDMDLFVASGGSEVDAGDILLQDRLYK